ncbi:9501_t:CDS:1, partial [Scutellospora calospora]
NMRNQFEGIRNDYKDVVNKQHSLIEKERAETSIVRRENSNLQRLLGLSEGQAKQLEIQLADKTNELNQNRQALDQLRQAFQDLLVSNATYQTEARVVKEQLD